MTQEERDSKLRPTMEAAVAKRYEAGLPVSYLEERCPRTAHFIHEYEDGRRYAFPIYGTLLRNALIPQAEIAEANLLMIGKGIECSPDDEVTHQALAGNGFGDVLFAVAIHTQRLND